MFIGFLYLLRAQGLKITSHEWLTLYQAIARGHAGESLSRFYYLTRAICCRTEWDFDLFDRCFAEFFEGVSPSESLSEDFEQWLKNAKPPRPLTGEEQKALETLSLEELRQQFEERMKQQKDRHDGGNRWIGTGGTSPFGHGGYHPSGIRVGGEGQHQHALQVASRRDFSNLRKDIVIDTRQIGLALRKLRLWVREGHPDELDLDGTIEATGRNAGDIQLVFRPERKNHMKLLLLMDVGGSMTYHARLCEQLFSAAHQAAHFKKFEPLYFHNCPYEYLFRDIAHREKILTKDLLATYDASWMLIMVGDAAMSPFELTEVGGSVDYYHRNDEPGLEWIQRLKKHFPSSVWLNPEPKEAWMRPSNQLIRSVFPDMFPLTLDGLDDAIDRLKSLKLRLGL